MYKADLIIDGETFAFDFPSASSKSIYISTIEGLTGTSASLDTVSNAVGIGEAVTGGMITSKNITIRGYMLDNVVATKRELLAFAYPLAKGKLIIYDRDIQREFFPYREINVVVKESPRFTQEKHSKFSLLLYAPVPAFKNSTVATVQVKPTGQGDWIDYSGDFSADYDLTVTPSANGVQSLVVEYWNSSYSRQKKLYLDFSKYRAGGLNFGEVFRLYRKDGILYAEVEANGSTTDALMCIDLVNSNFWSIDKGAGFIANWGITGDVVIKYQEAYSGVVVSGV